MGNCISKNFFWRIFFSIKLNIENFKDFKIKDKDNKIFYWRGNSLRNKVRGWLDLNSQYPLKPLPSGWENTERIASLYSYSQVLTEPVSLPGLPCIFNKAAAYCPQDDSSRPTMHSHRFDCKWLKLVCLCRSSVFTAFALLGAVCKLPSLTYSGVPKQKYQHTCNPKTSPTPTKREDC